PLPAVSTHSQPERRIAIIRQEEANPMKTLASVLTLLLQRLPRLGVKEGPLGEEEAECQGDETTSDRRDRSFPHYALRSQRRYMKGTAATVIK
ncbi:hypothetical protein KUCAC02_003771, partial [Chaenocephalus aceratus]